MIYVFFDLVTQSSARMLVGRHHFASLSLKINLIIKLISREKWQVKNQIFIPE